MRKGKWDFSCKYQELGERGNLALARRLLQRAVQNRITRQVHFQWLVSRNPYHPSVSTPPALRHVGGFLTASRKVNRPVTLQKANA